ncbi:transmembrane amino acid transporter protein-domain-containing protein [Mycena polygramma]|nr:transmembrane amino acid transporter protein-domain-containing protein [Mycena polygramma]
MASLPTSLQVGSASSGQTVRDAIESYRRSQYLVAGSTVASVSDNSGFFPDEEARVGFSDEEEQNLEEETTESEATVTPNSDLTIDPFDWDVTPTPEISESPSIRPTPTLPLGRTVPPGPALRTSEQPVQSERTPLLRKTISFTNTPHPQRTAVSTSILSGPSGFPTRPGLRSRSSGASVRSIKSNYGGQSTFGQTLFNSIAILLGIGMLSEPLAFAYAGWGMGFVLIIFYGYLSCYTAKILAGIIVSDPRLRSYADIGRKAFGPRATLIVTILFCLELFAVSVILVTLYGDSLNALIPRYSSNTYKLWGLFILLPTVFLPLSLLSYTSILGIISTIFLVIVILFDGVYKNEPPGSLWSPAKTSLGIDNYNHLGIAFGLFMAGFSGHAVIPSLARDMADPSHFDTMINIAFVVATSIYTLIGCAGYLMFGNSVSQEVSMDLLSTPGYNTALNQAALWMLVLSPLTKFALTTQPLNTAIQMLVGIDSSRIAAPEDLAVKLAQPRQGACISVRGALSILQRVTVTLLSVAVSILLPEFSAAMAFMGSFSAFVLCVIGPIAAKVALERRCGVFDGLVIILAVVMAMWGTSAAFLDA